jgi:hypothetical protein
MNQPDNKFMGHDGFLWWFGVVADRNDPLSLGRVRVRVFGVHPDDKTLVPDNMLPWAMPIQPITSAGAYGIGSAPVGPIPGSHVFGFWSDGYEKQIPFFMGTIAGGTGQFTFGEALGNIATSAGNAVGAALKDIGNFVLPPNTASLTAKAVGFAKILMNTL